MFSKNLTNFVHRCGRPYFYTTPSSTHELSFATTAAFGTTTSIYFASCAFLVLFGQKTFKLIIFFQETVGNKKSELSPHHVEYKKPNFKFFEFFNDFQQFKREKVQKMSKTGRKTAPIRKSFCVAVFQR